MYKLFYNGRFHALDPINRSYEALLVLADKIVFCGKLSDINLPAYQLNKTNLGGRHVYPGFTDCHTHIASTALKKERVTLDHACTRAQTLRIIADFAADQPVGSWILGGGWNANIWPDGAPAKADLDRICAEHPVALYNKDGHTMWLNSRAIELCAFEQKDNLAAGGMLGRDEQGGLNGLVFEKACMLVEETVGKPSYTELQRCMDKLAVELYALGITGAHSCEGMDIWILFQEMAGNKALPLRICMHPPMENMAQFTQAGLHSAFGNEWLRLGGLKYFIDGSLGSQTAEMFENFNHLNHAGVQVMAEDSLTEYVQTAAAQGLSSTIHAIGDKAVFKALNALETCRKTSAKNHLRHRIEHAQILRKEDIERFSRLQVIASCQPLHIAEDVKIADYYLGRRTRFTYALKSLLNHGCRVVFGSDMPVADPDPLKGLRAAAWRRYQLDPAQPSWQPQECISLKQALYAYTCEAAYASHEESVKGTLSPGKVADFFVINTNLEEADETVLAEIKVEMTVLGGNIVFQGREG